REKRKGVEVYAGVSGGLDHRDAAQRRPANGALHGGIELNENVGFVPGKEGVGDFEEQDIATAKARRRDVNRRGCIATAAGTAVSREEVELGVGNDANGTHTIVGAHDDAGHSRAVIDTAGTKDRELADVGRNQFVVIQTPAVFEV